MIYTPYYFENPQHADHCVLWFLYQTIRMRYPSVIDDDSPFPEDEGAWGTRH